MPPERDLDLLDRTTDAPASAAEPRPHAPSPLHASGYAVARLDNGLGYATFDRQPAPPPTEGEPAGEAREVWHEVRLLVDYLVPQAMLKLRQEHISGREELTPAKAAHILSGWEQEFHARVMNELQATLLDKRNLGPARGAAPVKDVAFSREEPLRAVRVEDGAVKVSGQHEGRFEASVFAHVHPEASDGAAAKALIETLLARRLEAVREVFRTFTRPRRS